MNRPHQIRRRDFLKLGCQLGAAACLGCANVPELLLPARTSETDAPEGATLLARLAHITDTHLIDEQSPARFPGAHALVHSAWRPYEAYATQLLDGIIRTVNRIHAAGRNIDFLLHTGDSVDNAQHNELDWLHAVMNGTAVNPLTGPDDRNPDNIPEPTLDPHRTFTAQGLYQQGTHGNRATIPWYLLLGNHDVRAIGVFPIIDDHGRRIAPLPLPDRPGLWLPTELDPLADFAYGRITPAQPGPPNLLERPLPIEPNDQRAYFNRNAFLNAAWNSTTAPTGHGLPDPIHAATWYSLSPAPGLRLIALDTTANAGVVPGLVYHEGGLSIEQYLFLRSELAAADQRGEIALVATHHPSEALDPDYGSEITADQFRALLSEHPSAVVHLAGHRHRNRVVDRGSYLEIETCSTLDLPQEGRLVEIWRDESTGNVTITYEMFSHASDNLPPLGDDPLRDLRAQAFTIAQNDKTAAARQQRRDPTGANPCGTRSDRVGSHRIP
jgi:3',5'-cyclic AMP phosphodiesterase CpdA